MSDAAQTTAYANRVAWSVWRGVMFKHWRRGNWHHRPEPIIAWRTAMAARWICLGCPSRKDPRYLRRVRTWLKN